MNTDEFENRLKAFRPRLHRYCARMTGSAIDGEDVLQDSLVKALRARADGMVVDNLEGWLLRIFRLPVPPGAWAGSQGAVTSPGGSRAGT